MVGWNTDEIVGIGEFSQLSGLSIDMLRRYHDLGLLVPAEVAVSGYRRYSLGQVERARSIAALRAVDLPLDDIAAFLDAADARVRFEVLLRHRSRLSEHVRTAAQRLEELDRLINEEATMDKGVDETMRAELLAMFEAQQAIGRKLFDATRSARPDRFLFELAPADRPAGYADLARQSHDHALQLDVMIAKHGWPGASVAGDDGAAAAWAVAQHADEDNDLCKRWLPLLRVAVDKGDAAAIHYAALVDRVRLRDREPQLYGTVVEPHERTWRLRAPIETERDIDARRDEIGLEPIADFLASLPTPDAWYEGEATAS